MPDSASPLAGRRIVVTRTQQGNAALAAMLRTLGAMVEEVPLLRIAPAVSYAPLDAALSRLSGYDLLLVTSASTACALASRRAPPWLDQPFTAAIGPGTADALRAVGLTVDLVPSSAVGEALLAALLPLAAGRRVLLPRAHVARDVLPDGLRAAGARVDVVTAYCTVPAAESRARLLTLFAAGPAGKGSSTGMHGATMIDYVTFTSGSTVDSFFLLLGPQAATAALGTSLACSIGPVTSNALRSHGILRVVEAQQHDLPGLAALLVEQASA